MLGVVIIVIVLLFVLVPLFLIGGGVLMALLGMLLKNDAVDSHPGSELIDLNR